MTLIPKLAQYYVTEMSLVRKLGSKATHVGIHTGYRAHGSGISCSWDGLGALTTNLIGVMSGQIEQGGVA